MEISVADLFAPIGASIQLDKGSYFIREMSRYHQLNIGGTILHIFDM